MNWAKADSLPVFTLASSGHQVSANKIRSDLPSVHLTQSRRNVGEQQTVQALQRTKVEPIHLENSFTEDTGEKTDKKQT